MFQIKIKLRVYSMLNFCWVSCDSKGYKICFRINLRYKFHKKPYIPTHFYFLSIIMSILRANNRVIKDKSIMLQFNIRKFKVQKKCLSKL